MELDARLDARHVERRLSRAAAARSQRRGSWTLALVVLAAVSPQRASAQSEGAAIGSPGYVNPDHWSRAVIHLLAARGLLDVSEVSRAWPMTRFSARSLLQQAAARAAYQGIAGDYLQRFDHDFGSVATRPWQWNAIIGLGWTGRESELLAGQRLPTASGYAYSGPHSRADTRQGAALVSLSAGWRAGFVAIDGAIDRRRVAFNAVTAHTILGPIDLWAGRRALQLGPGLQGGIVLNNSIPFDGLGLDLPDGVRLPLLGLVRTTHLLARMTRSGNVNHPWWLAQRVSAAPARTVTIGINRAAMFGGQGNDPVTLSRILWLLVGQTDTKAKDSDFENQVVSLDAIARVTAGVPLLIYGEVGIDDASGALHEMPAVLFGVEVGAIPGSPALSIGLEAARFSPSCCGHGPWYWHSLLTEGWTDRGTLLGHPLGGHGTEIALRSNLLLAHATFLASARSYLRDRGHENLFSPDRTGTSLGISAQVSAKTGSNLRIDAAADIEWGNNWRRWTANVSIEIRMSGT